MIDWKIVVTGGRLWITIPKSPRNTLALLLLHSNIHEDNTHHFIQFTDTGRSELRNICCTNSCFQILCPTPN
ncbi:MAG: hypothetical protein V9E86_07335 [Nitrosomonas sp.]